MKNKKKKMIKKMKKKLIFQENMIKNMKIKEKNILKKLLNIEQNNIFS